MVGNWIVLGMEENWLEPEATFRGPRDRMRRRT